MIIRIRGKAPTTDGLIGKTLSPYGRLPCGDHEYTAFLMGLGVKESEALRYGEDIRLKRTAGGVIQTRIPFMGHWVPFHLPDYLAKSRTWEFDWGKREVGLEWLVNGRPAGLEVYSPFDWTTVDGNLCNLFIGGLAWERDGRNLPGPVAGLKQLVSAGIANCPDLANVDLFSTCGRLTHLFLSGPGLRDLEALQLLPLESLCLLDTRHIRSLSFLRGLPRLRRLVLRNCRGLTDISDLAGHPSLRHVLIDKVPISSLAPLASVPSLEKLHLERLPSVRSLPVLDGSRHLRGITIRECPRMRDPGRLPPSVQALWVERSVGWDWKSILSGSRLRDLDLVGCGITQADLPAIASIPTLERLSLTGNTLVRSVHPLGRLASLKVLHLDYCLGLESLSGLGKLCDLKELSLTLCLRLRSIAPLANLDRLDSLSLAGLPRHVQKPGYLIRLKQLRQLSLAGWDQVADFSFLEGFQRMEYLDLRGRIFHESIAAVFNLPNLCYRYHTLFANIEKRDPKGPPQPFLRPLAGSRRNHLQRDEFSSIRGTWWDLPRPSRWDGDFLLHRAPCRDLQESIRSAMLSLLPKPAREAKYPFFVDERPRPGSPQDLAQRRAQTPLPEPSTNAAAVRELLDLTWAENPFDAGNRQAVRAAELALELDQRKEGEPLFASRPVGSYQTQTDIFRSLVQAIKGCGQPRPGSGTNPGGGKSLVLLDPDAPGRKVMLQERREIAFQLRNAQRHAKQRVREARLECKEIKANTTRRARPARKAGKP